MAVGFTPKHIDDISLGELTQQQFLALANETATNINWKVGYIGEKGFIAYTDNGMFSWNAEVKITIENGAVRIQSSSVGSEMMDWGKNKKNVSKFIAGLEEQKRTTTKEALDEKYHDLSKQLSSPEEDILVFSTPTTKGQIVDFISIFKPTRGFFVTPMLLNINILIFIVMALCGVNILLPSDESLLNWGANFRPMTLDGEWWRLLANCFLHIGVIHLLLNMYALLYIGTLLEPILGKTRFIVAYLLTGISASIASLCWHELTISAGASGAIFGMYGVFLALLTTDLIEKTARKALLASIAVFVGYNLIYGLKGGIDNAAHIGGLLGGLVIGYALIPSLKQPEKNKLKFGTLGLLAIIVLVSSFVAVEKTPNNIGTYDAKMKEFASMESMALEVFNLPASTPKDKLLYEIKDRGIYYWKENIKLVDNFKELDLPLPLSTRNQLLREYCELRINSYELLYKAISEDTDRYEREINGYNIQIESKVKELGALDK